MSPAELGPSTPRWIELDGAVNARVVVPGVLLRSDNLQSLSERDIRALIDDYGLESVIDLRTDVEVALEGPGPLTREPSVRIEHRSLYPETGGTTDVDLEVVKPWGDPHEEEARGETTTVAAYMSYLRRRPDSIIGSIETIARADGAVLVHCAAGKDRTGIVVALALDAAGAPREAIVEDYLVTAGRIEEIIARLVASDTYRDELEGHDPQSRAPRRESMERVLALIDERFGGTEAWLLANGLSEADLEMLRLRLEGVREGYL